MNFLYSRSAGSFARQRASNLKLGMSRVMMFALAFVALGFISLRPFCGFAFVNDGQIDVAGFVGSAGHVAAQQPDSGDGPAGNCCTSIEDRALVKPAESPVSWAQGGSLGAVLFASAGLLPLARSREPAWALLAVPPEPSFYVRSARILR